MNPTAAPSAEDQTTVAEGLRKLSVLDGAPSQVQQVITLAGEALRASEARYRALFELGPMAVYCCDAAGVIQEYNRRAAELWGREPVPGDAAQKFCGALKLLRPDGSVMLHAQSPVAEVLSGNMTAVWDAEVVIVRPDGTQVTVIVNIRPQQDEQGKITGTINCFYDISSRKQAEAAQRRAALLAASNQKLELEIIHRQKVEDALRASQETANELLANSRQMQEQLRQLSHQVLQAQEEERKRISRELHDVIAQTLTGINIRLALLQGESGVSMQDLHEKIALTQRLVAQSVDAVHRFARDLRPAMLDDLGLIPALQAYLKDFMQQTGIQVNLTADAGVEKLESPGRTVLYRVAQEALTNIVRHARASQVEMRLQQANGVYCMEITDNGQGFVADGMSAMKNNGRLGLLGMRERVEIIGGTFCIESAPGKHTTVIVEIPATTPAAEDTTTTSFDEPTLYEPYHHPAG